MLSSALGGMLRAGAVVLTAGALGGGVYFLVQAGDSQDDTTRLQAPSGPTATVEAPSDLSSPVALSGPVEVKAPPTPTFPPAPIADPGIDTSEWKTYRSPLGFTLKYPPGWEVFEDQTGRNATIANEVSQALAPSEDMSPGEAWVEIIADAFPEFDKAKLFEVCRPSDPVHPSAWNNTPSAVSIGGRPAVRCVQGDQPPSGRYQTEGNAELYLVQLPSGSVLHMAFYAMGSGAVQADEMTLGVLRTALASLSFEAAP